MAAEEKRRAEEERKKAQEKRLLQLKQQQQAIQQEKETKLKEEWNAVVESFLNDVETFEYESGFFFNRKRVQIRYVKESILLLSIESHLWNGKNKMRSSKTPNIIGL